MRLLGGCLALVIVCCASVVGASLPSCLEQPTDAPIVDPFRPPPCPWCPGNRGLEFATRPGDELRAMANGRVTFAGRVAGVLYLTIETDEPGLVHPDIEPGLVRPNLGPGLTAEAPVRITYGRLAEVALAVGDRVVAGTVVARAGGATIVTVRQGDTYVDPAPLIGRPSWRPRLVPRDATPARPARPSRAACI